jgi:hypothetical protein
VFNISPFTMTEYRVPINDVQQHRRLPPRGVIDLVRCGNCLDFYWVAKAGDREHHRAGHSPVTAAVRRICSPVWAAYSTDILANPEAHAEAIQLQRLRASNEAAPTIRVRQPSPCDQDGHSAHESEPTYHVDIAYETPASPTSPRKEHHANVRAFRDVPFEAARALAYDDPNVRPQLRLSTAEASRTRDYMFEHMEWETVAPPSNEDPDE